MHTAGHVGIGFGAAVPMVLALEWGGLGGFALPATAVLVGLSTLPDLDHHLPGLTHRGPTHSLPFALLVGVVVGLLGWLAGPIGGLGQSTVAVLGMVVGVSAVGGHLLGDLVTPMGVAPGWPIWPVRRSLNLVRSANQRANLGLFAAGLALWLATITLGVGG